MKRKRYPSMQWRTMRAKAHGSARADSEGGSPSSTLTGQHMSLTLPQSTIGCHRGLLKR
jgi:hypothetical protein